ncbi:phage tail assembly chaperone [Thermaurantiacus sp.]
MTPYAELARLAARVATGVLGWSPDQFWNATPAELRLALEGRLGSAPTAITEADLERLMREFPDA